MHLISDVIELINGCFSDTQLVLNYLAYLLMPMACLGLCYRFRAGKPGLKRLALVGSLLYSVSFVYFAYTSIYPLTKYGSKVESITYPILVQELGRAYFIYGTLMVLGGLGFGTALAWSSNLPKKVRDAGFLLLSGVYINAAVALLGLSPNFHQVGSLFRNVAFISLGLQILNVSLKEVLSNP